ASFVSAPMPSPRPEPTGREPAMRLTVSCAAWPRQQAHCGAFPGSPMPTPMSGLRTPPFPAKVDEIGAPRRPVGEERVPAAAHDRALREDVRGHRCRSASQTRPRRTAATDDQEAEGIEPRTPRRVARGAAHAMLAARSLADQM
ncbi:hypothetical protein, partial [Burkholderia pseudomallei]